MLAAVSISLFPSVDYTSTVNFLERDHLGAQESGR